MAADPLTRRAALAIGVSDAPPLRYLSGAVNGAKAFQAWASALGYDSLLVTDETEPVTIARVHAALEALLPASGTHRLLLYFAGHGVIREVEQGLWLPSDFNTTLRAIAIEPLRRRLLLYCVKQVAIFADACRSLPVTVDLADLTPDAVLGRGPGPGATSLAIDKFIAAQDGTETFMVPGADPQDDRCLFSGVLLEALWGTKPAAFSQVLEDKVTGRSLGAYLETEVAKIAGTYQVHLVPSASSTFPEGDDVYFGDGPPVTPPAFPPWPPASEMIALGARVRRTRDETLLDFLPPTQALETQLSDQERPDHFETGSGFVVDGQTVAGVWTGPEFRADAHGQPNWLRISTVGDWVLRRPAPVLIELAEGTFIATTALPEFIASIIATEAGAAGIVYREIFAPADVATDTERVIGMLERGGLAADAVTHLAMDLRYGKHADPVRGVIAAYLYDSIGDVDSIRRMAFAYAYYGEAIPYDIALLAQLEGRLGDHGLLMTTVPAVQARKPRTEQERGVEWTYSATRECDGVVGGFWPWLRQGWAFLDEPSDDGSTLVLPGILDAARGLTPARFTTLDDSAGPYLASLFNLQDRR